MNRLRLSHVSLAVALLAAGPAVATAQESWAITATPTTQNLWSVAWGGGMFVVVGENGTVLTSPDAITWTSRVSTSTRWLVGVGYGNGLFVIVGDQGTILTSPDGTSWTTRTSGTAARLNGVAFGGGRWLIVAESGEVLSSTDAVTWTKLAPSSDRLRGLTYAYGQFVITGDNGLMRTTIDTVDYDAKILPDGLFVESVAYGRRMFLAVGEYGYAIRSDDAVTWHRVATNMPPYFRGVTFFNGVFIVAGENGIVFTTPDGATRWVLRTTGTTALFTAVAASETAAVVVGFGGTIIRSVPFTSPPVIASSPADQVAIAGDNVLFSVTATGQLPLAYQWNFNGQPLPEQTSDRLLLSNVQAANAGTYSVTVTNARGTATSAAGALALVGTTTPGPVVDPTFNANGVVSGWPDAVGEQSDGKIVFSSTSAGVGRLNVDGSRDTSFNVGTGITGSVSQIVVQPDDRILIAGIFTAVDGLARPGLARLNADGSVDSLFVPPIDVRPAASQSTVPSRMVLQPDGKVLVLVEVAFGSTGLYRLNDNGALDAGFAQRGGAAFVAPLGNGQLVASRGAALDLLTPEGARLRNVDQPLTTPPIRGLLPFPDGSVLVEQLRSIRLALGVSDQTFVLSRVDAQSWWDYSWPGISVRGGITLTQTVAVTADGKILRFHSEASRRVLQRFNRDASIDYTFDMRGGPDNNITRLLPLRDGRTLVVGPFTRFDGEPRAGMARLVALNAPPRHAPRIVSVSPEAAAVRPGDSITLTVAAAGTGPLTYRWSDFVPAEDRGKTTVTVPTSRTGTYFASVTVANSLGSATSAPVRIVVAPSAPIVAVQPASIATSVGRTAVFTVEAGGSPPFTYEWFRGDTLVGTLSTLTLPSVRPTDAGNYTVVIRNATGATTSQIARLTVDGTSQLANISTRATAGPDERALIAGFSVSGTASKSVLVRGVSPSLAAFGLPNLLPNPVLTLYDAANRVVGTNDNWNSILTPPALFDSLGAFALVAGSADAVLQVSLAPGNYTAVLTDTAGRTGTALVEIYEADRNTTRIGNLSSRAFVDAGASIAISGIVVQGEQPGRFLIRAVGPTLGAFGVTGVLGDPVLTLTTSAGTAVATNDNWATSADRVAIATTTVRVGAFPLDAGSRDAVVLLTLAPGNYTAQVSGAANSSGVALIEVYEVR